MTEDPATDHVNSEQALLSHRIISDLRRAILAGELKPGARLRQEELAASFGISRIPVREALRQLESEGLVTLVPNSGAWIATLDLADCVEVYKIRERLEPLALSESITNMTDADIRSLEDIGMSIETNLRALTKDSLPIVNTAAIDNFLKLDREFHLLSYRAARMPKLYAMIERFWNTTQQYRRAYSNVIGPEGHWIIQYEHRLLIEAVKRRDTEEATRILYGHIRRTRLELQKHKEVF